MYFSEKELEKCFQQYLYCTAYIMNIPIARYSKTTGFTLLKVIRLIFVCLLFRVYMSMKENGSCLRIIDKR